MNARKEFFVSKFLCSFWFRIKRSESKKNFFFFLILENHENCLLKDKHFFYRIENENQICLIFLFLWFEKIFPTLSLLSLNVLCGKFRFVFESRSIIFFFICRSKQTRKKNQFSLIAYYNLIAFRPFCSSFFFSLSSLVSSETISLVLRILLMIGCRNHLRHHCSDSIFLIWTFSLGYNEHFHRIENQFLFRRKCSIVSKSIDSISMIWSI